MWDDKRIEKIYSEVLLTNKEQAVPVLANDVCCAIKFGFIKNVCN